MLKKTISFILLACILLLSCSFAAGEENELLRLRGYVDGKLSFESIYLDPHDGPGYEYYPVSLDLSKGTVVHVLSQASDSQGNRWVLVEYGDIRAYMLQKDSKGKTLISCDMKKVPVEPTDFFSVDSCMLYEDCELLTGPGEKYQPSGYTATIDDYGFVVLMNGDWALVVFQGDEYGASWVPEGRKVRGWIIMSNLVY